MKRTENNKVEFEKLDNDLVSKVDIDKMPKNFKSNQDKETLNKLSRNSVNQQTKKNFSFYNKFKFHSNEVNHLQSQANNFLKIQFWSFRSIFFGILIITIPIAIIINFYICFLILIPKWSNKKTNNWKYLWAALTIFPLGAISSFYFVIKGLSQIYNN